jgi:hypothetical protein
MEDVRVLHERGVSNVSFCLFQLFNLSFQISIVTRTNLPILSLNYISSDKEGLERVEKSSNCNDTTAVIICLIVIGKHEKLLESCVYAPSIVV